MFGKGAKHMLPKCPETGNLRKVFVCSKWLNTNEKNN
jgi:hypothetical protein